MGELIFLISTLVFFGVYIFFTIELPKESIIFPYGILIIATILTIMLIKKYFDLYKNYDGNKKMKMSKILNSKISLVIIFTISHVLLWNIVGFTISTFIFLFLSMKYLGIPFIKSIWVSILVSLSYNIIFVQLLKVPLPEIDLLKIMY